jgi:hypothetical protein
MINEIGIELKKMLGYHGFRANPSSDAKALPRLHRFAEATARQDGLGSEGRDRRRHARSAPLRAGSAATGNAERRSQHTLKQTRGAKMVDAAPHVAHFSTICGATSDR